MGAWFHKEWRGVFKPFSQWGKPIKLSTIHFVFCAQWSKSGWVSYCMGMGKVWRSISNWAEQPFWKNVFWLNGQVRTQKFTTHPLCIHVFSSSHVGWSSGGFPSFLQQFLVFSPWLGSCFVNVRWLGSLLDDFLLFPPSHSWGISFFGVAQSMGE